MVTSCDPVTDASNLSQVIVHDKLQKQQEVSVSSDKREQNKSFKISVPIPGNNAKHYNQQAGINLCEEIFKYRSYRDVVVQGQSISSDSDTEIDTEAQMDM